ncbi:MAG: hypothetical protein J1G38_04085 [Clostridiales bacterium]|nr:hypothetical protein [Clostridiales bacterium]
MEQKQTFSQDTLLKLLKQSELTIIAGADKHVAPFTEYLKSKYRTVCREICLPPVGGCTDAADAESSDGIRLYTLFRRDGYESSDGAGFIGSQAQAAAGEPVVVMFPCEKHAEWRSLYFRIDGDVKGKTQLLLLNVRDADRVDLVIERGEHAGECIPFRFDEAAKRYYEAE